MSCCFFFSYLEVPVHCESSPPLSFHSADLEPSWEQSVAPGRNTAGGTKLPTSALLFHGLQGQGKAGKATTKSPLAWCLFVLISVVP